MTGPVICGVDFSNHSTRALRWARWMSERLNQPLVAIHAIHPLLQSAANREYGPDVFRTSLQDELGTFIADALGSPERVRTEVAAGEAGTVIRDAAKSCGASVVVVGTQGLGQMGRLWFGSTTTSILRESTLPVLAVPPSAAERSDADLGVAEIIVGTDFGPAADAAIGAAQALSLACGVPVTALHAVPELPVPARWSAAVAQSLDVALRDARARMAATMPEDWKHHVRTGNASRVLVEAAAGRDALIVVGLGGTMPGRRPGTTAYRVLCDADVPVLAVPAR